MKKDILFYENCIDLFARALTGLFVTNMCVVVSVQVFFRYFIKSPLIWAEELARYSLVWLTFIGASTAFRQGQLACMDLIVKRLPPKIQKIVVCLTLLFVFILLLTLFFLSLQLIAQPSVKNQRSPAMGIKMQLAYLAMPVGTGLILIQCVFQLMKVLSRFGSGWELRLLY